MHLENPHVGGPLAHPSDGEGWKHLDDAFLEFADEPGNVQMGLSTDGFSPFSQFAQTYFCSLVILTLYNLLPWC